MQVRYVSKKEVTDRRSYGWCKCDRAFSNCDNANSLLNQKNQKNLESFFIAMVDVLTINQASWVFLLVTNPTMIHPFRQQRIKNGDRLILFFNGQPKAELLHTRRVL